jgi:Tfp pilus assembly protein PilN
MIKINLLNSVTERQGGAVVAVDRKVSSPESRLILTTIAVALLLVAVIGWDVISTTMAKSKAQKDLQEQQQIATELEVVMKEQKDLEDKIKSIDGRISAIKKLREDQRGPSAVLEAMRERIASTPGLYLQSIEQKGDQIEIRGNSPDESVVTQFGRSLEFSNGLFSNMNIETKREDVQNQSVTNPASASAKVNVVNFTVKTAYTPSKAAGSSGLNAAPVAVAAVPANPAAPIQVAKN